ncbi:MAG: hypothetical protein AAGJ11_11660 [Bacteroidota bacterium]
MPSRDLHVTVGVGPPTWPEAPVGFAADVRLVKAALLYGDTVTLCSPAAAVVGRLLRLEAVASDVPGKLAALEAVAGDLGWGDGPRLLAEAYATLAAQPDDRWLTASRRAWLDRVVEERWTEARDLLRDGLARGGHGGLLHAARAGWLHVDRLGVDGLASPGDIAAVAADTFAERMLAAVAEGLSVPMLDGATADLLRQRVGGVSEPRAGWGRQGGLAADWLPRLPLFDLATIAETVDIRRDLGRHLARFRAAVVAYAEAVSGAAWDADFPLEAERVYRRDVAPAVADIEDAVASTGALRALTHRFADGPSRFLPAAAPALTLGLAASGWVLDAVAWAVSAGTVGANALRAWHDAEEARRGAEGHRLYFLYAAGRRLGARV